MDQEAKDRMAANLSALPKEASTWAITAAGLLGTVWFALPDEQQMEILKHSPLPAWSYPVVLAVVGVIAKVWPQKAFAPPPNPPAEADATKEPQ
jgi:hypothetical protein